MKRIPFTALLLLLILIACNTRNASKQSIFTTHNLKSSFIYLQPGLPYTLKTPKGAILKIAAGSFKVDSNTKVQLELKEAYGLQDILLAGLVTESNGKPLLSGGMLYINATANGKVVDLVKPIKISVPTAVYDNRMQLFKGEISDDSTVNWIDPQPLDTSLTAKNLAWGEKLFKANCASCHKPTMVFTGPALAGCRNREPNKEWVYSFMKNSVLMSEIDGYAKRSKNQYGSIQPNFPELTKYEIKAILDYCDNEGGLTLDTTSIAALSDTALPCGYDTIYYAKPDTAITILKDDTVSNNVQPMVPKSKPVLDNLAPAQSKDLSPEQINPLNFTDEGLTGGMYDITVNAFGWYNLDVFMERYPGLSDVNLKVQLQTKFEEDMHVYLFCPDKKLLQEANPKNNDDYLFGNEKGDIPLFVNDKAVILAFGSKGDKMFYGTSNFIIKNEQVILINIKETNETELKSFIEKNNIDGIKIDLNKKEDFEIKQKPCDEPFADTVKFVKK